MKTIEWKNNKVKLIDQTLLPLKFKYIYIDEISELWQAIKLLRVRGAPALGAAGALGVYLGIKNSRANNFREFYKELEKSAEYLAASRPTAVNLIWGIKRMSCLAQMNRNEKIPVIKKRLLNEALKIIQEDQASCRKMAGFGSKLIKDGDCILTICNAGALATIDYGTALGVIYRAKKEGKKIKVFASETRPLLQGSRLTAWELSKNNIDITLICDNTAAWLMKTGRISKVIAGADRIAANGDAANKIGTYNLAILARYHNIPFYIAAPVSTFDLKVKSGKDIPIEQRDPEEVRKLLFKKSTAPSDVKVFNPAFDVTSSNLISAIITDKGIIRPVNSITVRKLLGR